jgi:hypothetical protein
MGIFLVLKDGVLSAFEHDCAGCYRSETDPIGADLLHIYYRTLFNSKKASEFFTFEKVS